MHQTFVKKNEGYLPKRKESVIDAEYEFVNSSSKEQKELIEAVIKRMQRIKDATMSTIID